MSLSNTFLIIFCGKHELSFCIIPHTPINTRYKIHINEYQYRFLSIQVTVYDGMSIQYSENIFSILPTLFTQFTLWPWAKPIPTKNDHIITENTNEANMYQQTCGWVLVWYVWRVCIIQEIIWTKELSKYKWFYREFM